jgi:hypothetical protein
MPFIGVALLFGIILVLTGIILPFVNLGKFHKKAI